MKNSKVKITRVNKFSRQPHPCQGHLRNYSQELQVVKGPDFTQWIKVMLLEKITLMHRMAAVSELLKDPKALKVLGPDTLRSLRAYRNRLSRRLSGPSTKPSRRNK